MTQSGEIPQFGYCDEINIDSLVRWALIQNWACKSLFTKSCFVNLTLVNQFTDKQHAMYCHVVHASFCSYSSLMEKQILITCYYVTVYSWTLDIRV